MEEERYEESSEDRYPNPRGYSDERYEAGHDVCPAVTVRVEPADQSLAQGGDTVLTCHGSSPGDTLTWEKVGSDLGSSTITLTRNILTITAASVTDRGLYVCNVENNCGAQGRASSLLEVSEIFSIKYFPSL